MRKSNQTALRSDVYKVLDNAQLSESQRLVAISALQNAETIANAFMWLTEKIGALGNYFLKPSLKH